MNGERITRRATVVDEHGAGIAVGPPFRIVGTADMDSGGQADIVWYNGWTGETQIWFMNGERLLRRGTVLGETGAPAVVGPPFRIVGAGDLYGDASADIVWHNSKTSDLQYWFMNGAQIRGRNGVVDEHGDLIRIGDPWRIAGVAGLADETAIVWHNAETNDIQYWFMNGPQIRARGGVTDEQGKVIQVGDPWQIV